MNREKLGEEVAGRGKGQGCPGGDGSGGQTRRGEGQAGAWLQRAWKREEGGPYHLPGCLELCMGLWGKEVLHPPLPYLQAMICSGPLDCLLLLLLGEDSRRFSATPSLASPCPAGPDGSVVPEASRKATGKGQGQGGTQL